ncbi:S8/S53 family peptidase [Pseudenhygromyxa sp. WMMC2535]|uniref:S8/S53 family peptidase n=1 Tax=Pseudenhygromyxa sp. WMMC2535 TaxID=2712867 RepID=UPI0015569A3A|nr:S8/S53 family peptidase [Pseudenhygromyxa sp. WMMC2535]NVB41251.1 S8/S53 family peptidase [Pseudenhygromyxa sp. WMMC2535]
MKANEKVGFCCVLSLVLAAGCDLQDEVEGDESVEHDQPAGRGDVESEPATTPVSSTVPLPTDSRNVCFSQGRLPIIARATLFGGSLCEFAGMPADWSATTLVEKLPASLAANIPAADPYRSYCEYTLDSTIPDAQAGAKYDELVLAMDTAPNIIDPRAAGVACLTAMPMSGTELGEDATLEASFAEILFESVGGVDFESFSSTGSDVNVFLVDNWAGDVATLAPMDEHGHNLARLLEKLTAGTGIDIVPIVGLPRMDGDLGTVLPGGGVKGTAPDLSVAFMTAAALHIEDNLGSAPARSIVNASVGGPPLDEDEAASDATAALIDATRTLACLGVQVNFAAGNKLPHESICGFDPEGLLFPGDLDGSFPAPTKAECQLMGYAPVEADAFYSYGSWQPNAISGVDALGAPLPNGRSAGSQTRIVANGVAAHTDAADSFMLTGTSVSTAVMSAASALQWRLQPDIGAETLTDKIAAYGTVLPRSADAGDDAGDDVRMIDICATVSTALAKQGIVISCPASSTTPYEEIGVGVQAVELAATNANALYTDPSNYIGTAPLCDGPDEFDMTDAMLNPSPTRPLCDNCTAGKDVDGTEDENVAYLGMTDAPWSTDLAVEKAILTVYDNIGMPTTFVLDEDVVSAMNKETPYENVDMIEVPFHFENLNSAELQLNYDDDKTMTVTTLPVWTWTP